MKDIANVAQEINSALALKQKHEGGGNPALFRPPLEKPLVTPTRYFVMKATMRKTTRKKLLGTKTYQFSFSTTFSFTPTNR